MDRLLPLLIPVRAEKRASCPTVSVRTQPRGYPYTCEYNENPAGLAMEAGDPCGIATSCRRGEARREAESRALDAQSFRLLDRGGNVEYRHGELTQVVAMLACHPNVDLSLVSDEAGIFGNVVPTADPEPARGDRP